MHTPIPPGSLHPPGRLIFAVDDEAGDLLLLARLLEQPGLPYPCRLFSSGEQLINALLLVLRGAPPPLVCFIDVTMSGMSGFDVLRWIRCQDALDSVAVIMLSGSDDPEHLHEACGAGAQCFTRKFPTATELRTLITSAQRYAEDRLTPVEFPLPCNLLLKLAAATS